MVTYMLMFIDDDDAWEALPDAAKKGAYAEVGAWWDDLVRRGVIKDGEELMHQNTAMTVRRVGGRMQVTDGPFIEAKEHVGGYALVEVADLDEAIGIAKTWPAGDVEIRPIVEH